MRTETHLRVNDFTAKNVTQLILHFGVTFMIRKIHVRLDLPLLIDPRIDVTS